MLDLGTGTGTLARQFALAGCEVVGVDPAVPLLEQAKDLDRESGVMVEYLPSRAEATGLGTGTFDVVTAGQCWHWFDRPAAAIEVRRVLRPGGSVAIAHFDWLPLPGNVVSVTEDLIQRYNPNWKLGGGTGLHPAWLADLSGAGFKNLETFSFDLPVPYSHEAWRGRIRASAGVAASLPSDAVSAFDGELALLLKERFDSSPMAVPHRAFALVGRRRNM